MDKIVEAMQISKMYRTKDPLTGNKKDYWCLKDINFTVEKGECIGLQGKNGTGKSTLLKIISNIVRPTSGRMIVNGHVAPMLDLSAGFHNELTGRENTFVYASLIGIKRKELKRNFDDIIDFAEVGEFLDNKLRSYSSGMKFRLAFSIASTLRPDLIIADEILATGDEDFQQRCLQRVTDLKASGTSIIIVQHDEKLIHSICDRTMLLKDGKVSHYELKKDKKDFD